MWVAVDGGTIVNPAPAKANVESAIIYGLSSVLHERVTLKDGVVEQSNFHDYNLMRMSDVPDEMHVQFVDVDTRPTGLGRDRQPVHRGRDLQRVPPAHRQAAAAPAIHAGARAGDAEGVRPRTTKRRRPPHGGRFCFRTGPKSKRPADKPAGAFSSSFPLPRIPSSTSVVRRHRNGAAAEAGELSGLR